MSVEQLFKISSQMLQALNDGHVRLISPGREVFSSNIYFREKSDDNLFQAAKVFNLQSYHLKFIPYIIFILTWTFKFA
jgi:hypothetical protein